jgi:hypothetical protein
MENHEENICKVWVSQSAVDISNLILYTRLNVKVHNTQLREKHGLWLAVCGRGSVLPVKVV